MKFLLDTHIFLWCISEHKKFPERAKEIIEDLNNIVYLSIASVWEALIKCQKGKLSLPENPEKYLLEQRKVHHIAPLELDEKSACYLPKLPGIHYDPFDRMLICQALAYDLTILTEDKIMHKYPVKTL